MSLQIVDVVVNAFCKTVLSALRNKKKPVRWAEPLLTTLLVNGTLQKTFLTRIWKLITEDVSCINNNVASVSPTPILPYSLYISKKIHQFGIK